MLKNIIVKKEITKGWSGDKKYYVETTDNQKYLYRTSPLEKKENREKIFNLQKELEKFAIPMCNPIAIGTNEEGVYIVQRWIEGKDAEDVIPLLSIDKQYDYGFDAGKILQKIHQIKAPKDIQPWEERFNKKIDRKIKMFNECPIKFENSDKVIEFINNNRYLLNNREQTFQHGDYHIGNMMIENDKLVIIDFDRYDFGDPWEEFNRIVWCAQKAPSFAKGLVDGYFDKNVPIDFWKLLCLYISSNTLSSVPWAVPFGEEEIKTMLNQAKDVLCWYDNMESVVPKWYKENKND